MLQMNCYWIDKGLQSYKIQEGCKLSISMSIETLPEEIKEKLSVLMTTYNDTYLHGIGERHDNDLFRVLSKPKVLLPLERNLNLKDISKLLELNW